MNSELTARIVSDSRISPTPARSAITACSLGNFGTRHRTESSAGETAAVTRRGKFRPPSSDRTSSVSSNCRFASTSDVHETRAISPGRRRAPVTGSRTRAGRTCARAAAAQPASAHTKTAVPRKTRIPPAS
ncbi:MAG: hypothetical protein DMF54_08625 [Acidobacteria bacterium]|nr:MAG: hypothetical protein DMF54_08625 [Acidobacteriota bacterium]